MEELEDRKDCEITSGQGRTIVVFCSYQLLMPVLDLHKNELVISQAWTEKGLSRPYSLLNYVLLVVSSGRGKVFSSVPTGPHQTLGDSPNPLAAQKTLVS